MNAPERDEEKVGKFMSPEDVAGSDYSEPARYALLRDAVTVRQYWVPGVGIGTSKELSKAQAIAKGEALRTGKTVPVLTREVVFPKWAHLEDWEA